MKVDLGHLAYLSQHALYWAVHLGRISFWVLTAASSFLVLLRLAILWACWPRLPASPDRPSRRRLGAGAAAALAVGCAAGLLGLWPDEYFLRSEARRALDRGDCGTAVAYYEPLARWHTKRPEVYENLATCYLKQQRYREAISALDRARALDPTPEAYLLSAYAHRRLGEPEAAREELSAAIPLARSPEQKEAILRELEQLSATGPKR